MICTVHLHGHLRRQFGDQFALHIRTAGEAVRALHANFGTPFLKALSEGAYRLVMGERKTGHEISLDDVNSFRFSGSLHIIPVPTGRANGSRKGGTLKVILGVALVGAAVFFSGGTLGGLATPLLGGALGSGFTAGTIGALGFAMALGGVSQMLAPKDVPQAEVQQANSFMFSGPINSNEQGNAVPLIYGRTFTGSQQISAGLNIEDVV